MDTETSYTYEQLKDYFRLEQDSGDPWGSCMSAWFSVAEYLHFRGHGCPDHWLFRAGCGMSDFNDNPEEDNGLWAEILPATDLGTVGRFGELLNRYSDKLKAAGRSY